MLLNIVEDAKQASDIVIEYSGYDGIKQILDDTSLQIAQIESANEKLILGV